ncbi:MAG: extracellular matrix regulator RemB, partial [Acutalibacteraceae bacterium]
MYLHLGKDTVVRKKDIIGIFDLDNSTVSATTRNYLAKAEKDGKVINVSPELP